MKNYIDWNDCNLTCMQSFLEFIANSIVATLFSIQPLTHWMQMSQCWKQWRLNIYSMWIEVHNYRLPQWWFVTQVCWLISKWILLLFIILNDTHWTSHEMTNSYVYANDRDLVEVINSTVCVYLFESEILKRF